MSTPTIGRVTPGRVVAAELVKVRTGRAIVAAAVTAAAFVTGVGTFAAVGLAVQDGAGDAVSGDPLGGALAGVSAASYAAATFGVLAVTSEYAGGTIKPTLAAVPRRTLLVLGKAVAVAVVAVPLLLASVVVTFLAARAIVATTGVDLSIAAPGVGRALVGAALYLTGTALLGVGFGWLLRGTAGAVAALIAVLVVPSVVGLFLPPDLAGIVVPYLPGNAGTAMLQLTPGGQLGPWVGLAVFTGYVGVTLAAAMVTVRRRDA